MTARNAFINDDCIAAMQGLAANSVDSIVTDPPYHLTEMTKRMGAGGKPPAPGADGSFARLHRGFMGQTWDGGDIAFRPEVWTECLRVLKPGGHLLAFGGTRTYHRMTCAIEDAGFEVRDCLAWLYGSGFPKVKTALKPAFEPVVMARKPVEGTVAANVARYGTGALGIDVCRIGTERRTNAPAGYRPGGVSLNMSLRGMPQDAAAREAEGRWPANVALDEEAGALLDAQTGEKGGGFGVRGAGTAGVYAGGKDYSATLTETGQVVGYGDSGGASRFFYCAKASTSERSKGLDERNPHPTVKPLSLMTWLIRLITPEGGIVLDPFAGSGSTCVAAKGAGFGYIGIEQSTEYADVARARIAAA